MVMPARHDARRRASSLLSKDVPAVKMAMVMAVAMVMTMAVAKTVGVAVSLVMTEVVKEVVVVMVVTESHRKSPKVTCGQKGDEGSSAKR